MSSREIDLTFEPSPVGPLAREPVTIGVPFPPGALGTAAEARLFAGPAELFCQRQVLSTWPDGSVRWLLLDFQLDLSPDAPTVVRLAWGDGPSQAVLTETGVSLAEDARELVVDNGPLRVLCRTEPFLLFDSVLLDGTDVFETATAVDFRVVDLAGRAATTSNCHAPTVTVEAPGPIRTALRIEGSHVDDAGHPLLDFSILLTVWADQPRVGVDYQIIHRGGSPPIELHEVAFRAAFAPRDPVHLTAHPGLHPRTGGEMTVQNTADEAAVSIPRAAARGYPSPETFVAAPWLARAEGARGVAVGVRHAVQQFPKRLHADPRTLSVGLYPPRDTVLRLRQGAAKTHQLLFCFHAHPADTEATARRFRLFNCAPRPTIPAAAWREAAAFAHPIPAEPIPAVGLALGEALDHRPRALGILHFGDEPLPGTPDGAAWANNSFDLAHALLAHYARTGARRHFAAAEALVRHVLDMDFSHFSTDPDLDGALVAPGSHQDSPPDAGPDHQWLEGILDFYHLTGHTPAFHAARRVGENLLRRLPALLEPGGADAPALGRTLYALTVLCRELGRPQHFDAARKLFERLAAGGPALRLATAAEAAMPLTAMARYHDVAPDAGAADAVVAAVDALLAARPGLLCQAGTAPFGLADNALLLEPLAFASRHAGHPRYIQAGVPLVRRLVFHGGLHQAYEPTAQCSPGDAAIQSFRVAPLSGTHLARIVRPLLVYIAQAADMGLLDTLGLGHPGR